MATAKENYLGRCFTLKSTYGPFRKVSLGPDDLKKITEFAATNNGWANILIKNRKTTSATEVDFYVELDTWKPDADKKSSNTPF